MQIGELVFFVFAGLALVSAGVAVFGRDSRRSCFAFALGGLAVAGVEVLLWAPVVAAIQAVVALGVLVALAPAQDRSVKKNTENRPKWVDFGITATSLGLLGFVFISTWARQWVTEGEDVARRPEFGTFEGLSQDLVHGSLLSLELIGALMLCAVIATVALTRVRSRVNKDGTSE